MKLDGAAVHYLLLREFGEITWEGPLRSTSVDYPLLYDVTADMSGHTILVPEHERPKGGVHMEDSLCVCMGEASARAACDAGLAVVQVLGDVTFQHLYNYMQAVFVKVERLDARLHAYVDAHAGFQPLLDACAQVMECPCMLVDDQYRTICQAAGNASADDGASDWVLEVDTVDLFMASRGYRHMRQSRNVYAMPGATELMMKNVFVEGRLVGTLIMPHAGDVWSARYVRFVLKYLSYFVEEMYARVGSFNKPDSGYRPLRYMLERAVAGEAGVVGDLERALAEEGHGADTLYVVLSIERSFTNDGPQENDYLARRFERACSGSCCFSVDGRLFMLADTSIAPAGRSGPFLKDVSLVARENLSKLGVSREFASMEYVGAAQRQASAALECGRAVDATNWCYRFDDLALSYLVMKAKGEGGGEWLAHPAIGVLQRYDDDCRGGLLETLSTFMRCRYNATAASDELFIARSTLLHRLDRIVELTGIELDDPDERLYLALSFAMCNVP